MDTKAKYIIKKAMKQERALGAFNVSSIEALQAVFNTAGQTKNPVIIQTSKGEAEYLLPEVITVICKKLATLYKVDYILHLDRGNDIDLIKRCLKAGYDSISSEFSDPSYKEIVKKTLAVRKLTNQYLAFHEGAIEIVPLRYYKDNYQKDMLETDPDLAKRFVEETKVDSLAVSIGNQSGKLKTKNKLNIKVLKKIHRLLPNTPLVLHGGSFLDDETIANCVKQGVVKINVNSEVRLAYTHRLLANINKNPDEYAPYRLLNGVKNEMELVVKEKILLFAKAS